MPSKLDDASNLRFLYACLQTCDFPAINYHKVAKQFGIQAPAARIRLRRLRDSLEGKEGGPKVSKKQMAGDGRRRPRGGKKIQAKEGYEKKWNGPDGDDDDDDDDDDEDVPLRSVKSGDRGSDAELKKEDREETEDWKKLPEIRPLVRPAVPQVQMYEASAFVPVDAKMPPAASPIRQMTLQVQPQMSMYDMAEPYMFPSAHVALPQMPYYQTSFSQHPPEQYQHRPQYEAATPYSDVQPDSKQAVSAEELSGEHVVDSKIDVGGYACQPGISTLATRRLLAHEQKTEGEVYVQRTSVVYLLDATTGKLEKKRGDIAIQGRKLAPFHDRKDLESLVENTC